MLAPFVADIVPGGRSPQIGVGTGTRCVIARNARPLRSGVARMAMVTNRATLVVAA